MSEKRRLRKITVKNVRVYFFSSPEYRYRTPIQARRSWVAPSPSPSNATSVGLDASRRRFLGGADANAFRSPAARRRSSVTTTRASASLRAPRPCAPPSRRRSSPRSPSPRARFPPTRPTSSPPSSRSSPTASGRASAPSCGTCAWTATSRTSPGFTPRTSRKSTTRSPSSSACSLYPLPPRDAREAIPRYPRAPHHTRALLPPPTRFTRTFRDRRRFRDSG